MKSWQSNFCFTCADLTRNVLPAGFMGRPHGIIGGCADVTHCGNRFSSIGEEEIRLDLSHRSCFDGSSAKHDDQERYVAEY